MNLAISGGNSVTLNLSSLAYTGTDSQTLAFGSGTTTQTTLAIDGGNSLTLQASGSLLFSQTGTSTLELTVAETDASKIIDSDGDTQIEVERGNDDDTIRLSTAGVERMQIGSDVTNITTDLSVTATDTTLNSNLTVAKHHRFGQRFNGNGQHRHYGRPRGCIERYSNGYFRSYRQHDLDQ